MIDNLLVIGAILTLAGAFMWLKPSRRDRHLSRLRSQAMASGLKLQSVRLPDTSSEGRLAERHELKTLYRLIHHFDKHRAPFFTVQRTTGVASAFLPEGWRWKDGNRPPEAVRGPLAEYLEALPACVEVVEARPDGVGVAWDEREADALPSIREMLERLARVLSA